MRTLYLDCQMGCAGDMFSGALFDLLSEPEKVECLDYLKSLDIPEVSFATKMVNDCGVVGTSFNVIVNGDLQEGPGGQIMVSPSLAMQKQDCNALDGIHEHRTPEQVVDVITSLGLNHAVESDALAIFALLARAEASAHGVEVSEVHFHEVGAMDAIADVVAASVLMWLVNPALVLSSAVNVGSGTVTCEHGVLPVPTPAVSALLRSVPIYGGSINGEVIKGELCTPTGAAILRHFVREFTPMPRMRVTDTGSGFGHLRFDVPNCLRAFIGDMSTDGNDALQGTNAGTVGVAATAAQPMMQGSPSAPPSIQSLRESYAESNGAGTETVIDEMPTNAIEEDSVHDHAYSRGFAPAKEPHVVREPTQIVNKLHIDFDSKPSVWSDSFSSGHDLSDAIAELSCNIDDMSPEDLGFAFEALSDMPETLDVFMQPIQMKKSRPGTMLTVLVRPEHVSLVAHCIFHLTTTIGIRKTMMSRMVLDRQIDVRDTPLGKLRVKVSEGYGVKREKPEYDDVARAFRQIRETE